jgi:hypothetical protein
MSIHQAKNREFDRVVVLWPYEVSGSDERKRRLAYNTITRARHEVHVIVQNKARVGQSPFVPGTGGRSERKTRGRQEVRVNASRESQHLDRKSLRKVTGSTADFGEFARDCVCFANGAGGTLLIGIEDDADAPSATQRIDPGLLDRIRKRVGELTVNVQVAPGAEASRERRRVHCAQHPSCGGRRLDERWPVLPPRRRHVPAGRRRRRNAPGKRSSRHAVGGDDLAGRAHGERRRREVASFCARLRASDRVKPPVKEKSDDELLAHYGLAKGDVLTNLGVLLVGGRRDRACLGSPPSCRPSSSSQLPRSKQDRPLPKRRAFHASPIPRRPARDLWPALRRRALRPSRFPSPCRAGSPLRCRRPEPFERMHGHYTARCVVHTLRVWICV